MTYQPRRFFCKGFTLIETAIAVGILGTLSYTITNGLVGATLLRETINTEMSLANQANSVINDLADELRSADFNYIYNAEVQYNGSIVHLWSFRISTGLDSLGQPIYDTGDYGRVVQFDEYEKTLVMYEYGTETTALENLLAADVTSFSIMPNTGSILVSNQMQLALSMEQEDSFGKNHEMSASRTVFLRSTMYNSDGFSAVDITQTDETEENGTTTTDITDTTTTEETGTTTDTTTEETTDTTTEETTDTTTTETVITTPTDIHEDGGPSYVWGNNSASNGEVYITISINAAGGTSFDRDTAEVALQGADTSGLNISYGWSSNPKKDTITISGTAAGSFAITINGKTTSSNSRKATGTTQESNYY